MAYSGDPRSGDTVAIDPSVRSAGVAWFRAGTLKGAARITCEPDAKESPAQSSYRMARKIYGWITEHGIVPRLMVCEWPQIYSISKSKADPNLLLGMVGVDGFLGGMLALLAADHNIGFEPYSMTPAQWKHQVTKDIVMHRVAERLEGPERDHITRSHDAMEAIGIGLTVLGRFDPKWVYH